MDLDNINKPLRDKEEWDILCFTLDLFDKPGLDPSSHLPTQHDLTKFFPNDIDKYHHQGGAIEKDDKLWFPLGFRDAPSICREINNQSCLKAGYELVCDTKKKRNKYTKTVLRCQCHRRAKESKGTKNLTESTKTQDDMKPTCGVYVNLYEDNNGGQFFFRRNGGHCFHHSGHCPLQKELKEVVKRNLPKSAVEDAHELIKRNVSKTIIQEMIEFKHNAKLKATTIQKMREAVLVEEFGIDKNEKETTAQTLLNWLEAKPDVDYVAYLGSYEQAQNTVKVRKERKKGKRTRVVTKNSEDVVMAADDVAVVAAAGNSKSPPTQEMIPTSSYTDGQTDNVVIPVPEKSNTALAEDPSIVNDVSSDAESFVKNLITQLTTGDGTILLAVMWITDDGKLYHKKFPHILGCDVTFGTNAEKRPLFRASGKTMNNKNIPHINAFIPSEQRWIFDWIFEDAIPSILDEEDLRKTSIILSDQDNQLVGALLTKLRDKGTYGNALNRLCKWHKMNRNYNMGAIKHKKTETDSEFVETIIWWLYHFTNEIETEAQMNDSYEKLEEFIADAEDDTELSDELVKYTSTWLRESFKPLLRLLCQCYYQDVPCGDVNANCFVESDNAALKKDPMRPKANNKLYVSAKNIVSHTNRRMHTLKAEAAKKATSQLLPKPSDNELDTLRRKLSKDIVEHKREIGLQQYVSSSDYSFHIATEADKCMTCLVRKVNVVPPTLEEKGPIPSYHRTHQVDIFEDSLSCGTTCVVIRCGCKMQKKVMCPCRHIYSIIGEAPKAEHFGLEVFKLYEANYAEDLEYTMKVDRHIKEVDRFEGALLLRMNLLDFKNKMMKCEGVSPREWYMETLTPLGVDVNLFQQSKKSEKAMSVNEALLKEDDGRKRYRSTGTHSKHNGKRTRGGTSLAMITDVTQQSAYTRLHKLFRQAADGCESEEDISQLTYLYVVPTEVAPQPDP